MKKNKNIKNNIKVLDLHGFNKIDAELELENFFIIIKNQNIKKCKIITGWGQEKEPILFNFTKTWLEDKAYDYNHDLGSFVVNLS